MTAVHRPLITLLVSFCCGITAGHYLPIPPLILAAVACIIAALLFRRILRGLASRLLPLLLFVVIGGLASSGVPDSDQIPNPIQRLLQHDRVVLRGTISHPPRQGHDKTRLHLRLEAFKEGDDWRTVSGNLLLTVRECRKRWLLGQRLIGRVRLRSIRNFNNPGGADYRQYLANQRIWATGYVRRDTDLVPVGKPRGLRVNILNRIRTRSRNFLELWLPPDHADLYRALLLGERFALRTDLRELLYRAGVGHLLAISGLHLGLVAGFVFMALHFVLVRIPAFVARWAARPGAALAALPVAVGYGLLTGMGLPALRATIMLAVLTLALVLHRERDLFNSLLLAAMLILSLFPEALFAASFQLSFMAVTALIWAVPRLPIPLKSQNSLGRETKWRWRGVRLYQFICASMVLSLSTAPVVLYHFHRLTLTGLLTNLLVVPVVGFLVLPAGLLALLLLPISTALAGFVLTLGSLGLDLVITIATEFGSLSWAVLWPGTPTVLQVGLAYILLLLPFTRIRRLWKASLLFSVSSVLVVSWVLPAHRSSEQSLLRVTYLDVSQGSAAIVELPNNGAMLIDGGGFYTSSFDIGRHVVAPYLWHRRIARLEAMVLSHAHPDHLRGLNFVATHFPIKQFWYNKVKTNHPDFIRLMDSLAQKGVLCLGPQELEQPRHIQGVEVKALHPPADFIPSPRRLTDRDLNNLSLVLRLRYGKVSFLFPGDIEKKTEHRLTSLPDLEPVDVLLVPHHGSRTSSSLPFLKKLQPRIAVYSVGFENRFHFPVKQVRERYGDLGVRTFRTDHQGAVTISTDGRKIEVKTFLE
jgi:competence protein ComEC